MLSNRTNIMKKQRNYRVRPPQLTVIEKLHQLLCPMKYRLISVAYTSASTKFPKCLLLCISYSQSNLSHFVLHISIYWGCGVSSGCRIVMEDGGYFDSNCSVSSEDFALPTTITVFLLWNYHGIFTIELLPSFSLQSFQCHNPSNANLFLPLSMTERMSLSAGCVLCTGSEPKKSPGVDLPNVSVRDCNLSNKSAALVASWHHYSL